MKRISADLYLDLTRRGEERERSATDEHQCTAHNASLIGNLSRTGIRNYDSGFWFNVQRTVSNYATGSRYHNAKY